MTVHQKRKLLEMFTDRTPGETYSEGRLSTVLTDSGSVALLAYGWAKIAEYDEERGVVTVFTGHKAIRSSALSRYINDARDVAIERGRDVILSGESPNVDTPNDGIRYVGNYVNFTPNRSAVEEDVVTEVEESIEAPVA